MARPYPPLGRWRAVGVLSPPFHASVRRPKLPGPSGPLRRPFRTWRVAFPCTWPSSIAFCASDARARAPTSPPSSPKCARVRPCTPIAVFAVLPVVSLSMETVHERSIHGPSFGLGPIRTRSWKRTGFESLLKGNKRPFRSDEVPVSIPMERDPPRREELSNELTRGLSVRVRRRTAEARADSARPSTSATRAIAGTRRTVSWNLENPTKTSLKTGLIATRDGFLPQRRKNSSRSGDSYPLVSIQRRLPRLRRKGVRFPPCTRFAAPLGRCNAKCARRHAALDEAMAQQRVRRIRGSHREHPVAFSRVL